MFGGAVAFAISQIPELIWPGNPYQTFANEQANNLFDKRPYKEYLLKVYGIHLIDDMPLDLKKVNSRGFNSCEFGVNDMRALINAIELLPKYWWRELTNEKKIEIFLFSNRVAFGVAWFGHQSFVLGFYSGALDNLTIGGSYASMLDVAHEVTHLLTMRSYSVMESWHKFLSEQIRLPIASNNSIDLSKNFVGYIGYGNTCWTEFIAVASSLYITGKKAFFSVYREFLNDEQIMMLYDKLKEEIYYGFEYETGWLEQQLANVAGKYPQIINEALSSIRNMLRR